MDDGGDVRDGVDLMQAGDAESTDDVSSSLRAMGYSVDGGGPDESDPESTGADRSLLEMASVEDLLILLGVLVVLVLFLTLLVT